MHSINLFTQEDRLKYCIPRAGERKIGETVVLPEGMNWTSWLDNQRAPFVILGVPEDIGVRANQGIGGARTAWEAFLRAFLNVQDNQFLNGKQIILLGNVNLESVFRHSSADTPVDTLRSQVAQIDDILAPIIEAIVNARKIPIVIGGGHNNAFPLLKGLSKALGQAVNAVNLDAHADFRALEGRHSGNGFSYAYHQGYLKKYFALGLHQAYNNAEIIAQFSANKDLNTIWFEEIFQHQSISFGEAVAAAINHVNDQYFGVELDVDCIEDTLSSAQSPLGISMQDAVRFLHHTAQKRKAAYLHLTEAAAVRDDGLQNPFVGKLLSYLVQVFVKEKKFYN
jgi:formiminoglutamase